MAPARSTSRFIWMKRSKKHRQRWHVFELVGAYRWRGCDREKNRAYGAGTHYATMFDNTAPVCPQCRAFVTRAIVEEA